MDKDGFEDDPKVPGWVTGRLQVPAAHGDTVFSGAELMSFLWKRNIQGECPRVSRICRLFRSRVCGLEANRYTGEASGRANCLWKLQSVQAEEEMGLDELTQGGVRGNRGKHKKWNTW